MMYTRERLMKAVRDAGRDGRQFTLGEVRAELGIKSRDKREQKRFRSRFRECGAVLGDNLEKLGPNTFRLKAAYLAAHPVEPTVRAVPPAAARASKPVARNSASAPAIDPVILANNEDEWKRRPRERVTFDKAPVGDGAAQPRQLSFSERVSSWFGRRDGQPDGRRDGRRARAENSGAASVALSRLAVELQPKAAGFEYRWIDGKLEVQRANANK